MGVRDRMDLCRRTPDKVSPKPGEAAQPGRNVLGSAFVGVERAGGI